MNVKWQANFVQKNFRNESKINNSPEGWSLQEYFVENEGLNGYSITMA